MLLSMHPSGRDADSDSPDRPSHAAPSRSARGPLFLPSFSLRSPSLSLSCLSLSLWSLWSLSSLSSRLSRLSRLSLSLSLVSLSLSLCRLPLSLSFSRLVSPVSSRFFLSLSFYPGSGEVQARGATCIGLLVPFVEYAWASWASQAVFLREVGTRLCRTSRRRKVRRFIIVSISVLHIFAKRFVCSTPPELTGNRL